MKSDRAQVAHIMRRAGFGATPTELDELTAGKTYGEIVDDLVNPERLPEVDPLYLDLYFDGQTQSTYVGKWLYRMVNTERPLEEKMALFFHHIFPVSHGKSEHDPSIGVYIDMLRGVSLTDFKTILLDLAKDPAMIFWLDNNENHKDEINENWGRELLELFTMGIGNYTEDDIKSASRAFTGWTFRQPLSLYPMGHHNAVFEYLPENHDDGEKTFLGHTGNLNGEDIIDIIVKQPATARFISRHLYNFFVEDEPLVPAWSIEPPRDEEAIEQLSKIFPRNRGRHESGAQGAVKLRLLQEVYRQEKGEEPRGVGSRGAETDRGVSVSKAGATSFQRHRDSGRAGRHHEIDGPGTSQPAHR